MVDNSDICDIWFRKCFSPHVPNERPILLIVDGYKTQISCVIHETLGNGICFLKLPPHTTHLLQPLDVDVLKSMKVTRIKIFASGKDSTHATKKS